MKERHAVLGKRLQEAPASDLDPGAGLIARTVTLPDGRGIRAVTAGNARGPLIVLEAGMSAPAASWVHTQRELSAHAQTLSYDRAGYGGSDPDPSARTIERLAEDLATLLEVLGETRPVVLVGHSWGGPILRCFADRHPGRVAGLVFVDTTFAEIISPKNAKATARAFQVMGLLARGGGANLVMRMTLPRGFSDDVSAEDRAILKRDYACVPAMRAASREAAQMVAALPTLRRLQAAGTPDVPTVCVQAGRVDRGMATWRPLLNRTAEELMAAVPNGRVVVVPDAGHLLPQEQPKPVHEAILDVLAAAKEA